jgi:hypothetical protein
MAHHPVHQVEEELKELAHEAEEGQSARTPLIVLGGVSAVVLSAVAILLVLAFLAYYLS